MAQPKAMDGGAPGSPSKAASTQSAPQRSYTFPVPTATKVMEVLSSFQKKNPRASKADFFVLFHLVAAVGDLASESESQQSDAARVWTSLVRDGRLERAIAETFTDRGREPAEDNVKMEVDKMGSILRMKCEVWRGSYER